MFLIIAWFVLSIVYGYGSAHGLLLVIESPTMGNALLEILSITIFGLFLANAIAQARQRVMGE